MIEKLDLICLVPCGQDAEDFEAVWGDLTRIERGRNAGESESLEWKGRPGLDAPCDLCRRSPCWSMAIPVSHRVPVMMSIRRKRNSDTNQSCILY